METTEGFERHLREVLHGADDQAAGFTAAQVIAGGRQRRRTRTAAASGVALVTAGAVAVVPSAVVGGFRHGGHGPGGAVVAGRGPAASTGSVPTTPGPAAPSSGAHVVPTGPGTSPVSSPVSSSPPSATSSSWVPTVRVVSPGKTSLGDGYTLILTANSVTVTSSDGGQNGPFHTDNGNQPSGSISLGIAGSLVFGLYIGPGAAASGTATVGGKAYPLAIVTLAGRPGWSVAYAMLPTLPKTISNMSISVSDASGHQLASLAPPPVH